VVLGASRAAGHLLPDRGWITVGRSRDATIYLSDPEVSRIHLLFEIQRAQQVLVMDAGSSNGSRVGGRRLLPHEVRALEVGEVIEIGRSALVLQRAPGLSSEV
jgi:S-DNA-T family DNA segregation ATPase FtsK/SpoIIIE